MKRKKPVGEGPSGGGYRSIEMNKRNESIDLFWDWFKAHEAEFDALREAEDSFWNVAVDHLQQIDDHLWFELSEPDENQREFVITAEGNAELFPLVEAIVERAPEIPGWQFIALKQPMGFEFATTYEGIRFDPGAMWFLPLDNAARPDEIGLRVGVPDYSDDIERQATNAVAVILETALGERAASLDIQHVEVAALPDEPNDAGWIELRELANYIAWKKRQIGEG